MYYICPKVKEQLHIDGEFTLNEVNLFCERNKNVFIDLQSMFKVNLVSYEKANMRYQIKPELDEQEYEIYINPECVEVYASSDVGLYYATKSIKQLFKEPTVRCGYIKDRPDLKVRGFMHDISRNKVPK